MVSIPPLFRGVSTPTTVLTSILVPISGAVPPAKEIFEDVGCGAEIPKSKMGVALADMTKPQPRASPKARITINLAGVLIVL